MSTKSTSSSGENLVLAQFVAFLGRFYYSRPCLHPRWLQMVDEESQLVHEIVEYCPKESCISL